MADEPTGNLDEATTHSIMELFSRMHKKGHTILLITHEDDVAAFAQRTVIIRDGCARPAKDGAYA